MAKHTSVETASEAVKLEGASRAYYKETGACETRAIEKVWTYGSGVFVTYRVVCDGST